MTTTGTRTNTYVIAAPFPANELAEDLCELGLAPNMFGACPESPVLEEAGIEWVTCDLASVAELEDELCDIVAWPAGDRAAMISATDGALQ